MTKITIRNGVFETNSSSAHTVVITENNGYFGKDDIHECLQNKNISTEPDIDFENPYYLPQMEIDTIFGHQFSILNEWYEKLAYIIASYKWNITEYIDAILSALQKVDKNIIGLKFKSEYTPFDKGDEDPLDDEAIPFRENYTAYEMFGEVDHQSHDNINSLIFAMRQDAKYKKMPISEIFYEIIFNKKFVIITDSDSSYCQDEVILSGMCNAMNIEKVLYYDSELNKKSNEWSSHFRLISLEDWEERRNKENIE